MGIPKDPFVSPKNFRDFSPIFHGDGMLPTINLTNFWERFGFLGVYGIFTYMNGLNVWGFPKMVVPNNHGFSC